MPHRLARFAFVVSALLLAGCHDAGRPSEALMSKADLNARGDALIRQGESDKLEAMNLPQDMFRRSGPNKAVEIRDADDTIQHGRALKAKAAGM